MSGSVLNHLGTGGLPGSAATFELQLAFAVSTEAAELVGVSGGLLVFDVLQGASEELVGDDGALGDSGVILFELREGERVRANTELDAEATTACEWRADLAERALCLRLLQCELESGCAEDNWSCFCAWSDGCFAGSGAGVGVCRAELEAALRTTNPNVVATHSVDPALPGAQATILARCLAESGCDSCFPPKNRCPVIDSASADPDVATVGETITLRVSATDPDDGPNPLGYNWIASHFDSGFLGSIAEPSQAETSFTCELAETGHVVVTATDGLCGDVRYIPVTCLPSGG